jgi:hypothetical protein
MKMDNLIQRGGQGRDMDHHIKEYYSQSCDNAPRGHFHAVISLNDSPKMTWEEVVGIVPKMCRGWYELAHLSPADRIEFTRDFWLAKLPYHPLFDAFLTRFFESLDDIGIFIVQPKFDDPYQAHLVYSLKGDAGFFRGALPASSQEIADLEQTFFDFRLPADYLAFLQIHNGFSKTTDSTGVTCSSQVGTLFRKFQIMIQEEGAPLMTSCGTLVDPKTLIPFYESFGMPFFQCFWAEWYPEQEMGNVYYSGLTKTISDIEKGDLTLESMAFPTFTDWLIFYMERIE